MYTIYDLDLTHLDCVEEYELYHYMNSFTVESKHITECDDLESFLSND